VLAAGDHVRIVSTGSRAKVVEVRADRAWVEAGALKLEVPLSELETVDDGGGTPAGATRATGSGSRGHRTRGTWTAPSVDRALIEVDLRGMRVDEMEGDLTKALDEALLGDLDELRIIHGKGTGALRQRVAELLEQDGRVADFRMGVPQEGGAGVTIARFRR
jgi:DNA mismatch repair protein MutS2